MNRVTYAWIVAIVLVLTMNLSCNHEENGATTTSTTEAEGYNIFVYAVSIEGGKCELRSTPNGEPMKDIVVFEKDKLIVINMTTYDITMTFAGNNPFNDETDKVFTVRKGKREKLNVRRDANTNRDGFTDYNFGFGPCTLSTGSTGPKVKVGDDG